MNTGSTAEIEAVEQREVEAILRSDLETLKNLWSEDLIAASNENLILTKRQLFALFEAGLVQLESLKRSFSKISIKDNAAFVAGHQTTIPKIGRNAGTVEYASYLSSWIREGGVWRLAARHSAAMLRVPRGDER